MSSIYIPTPKMGGRGDGIVIKTVCLSVNAHISNIPFIYSIIYVAFNTVQVISQQVVLWAAETSTYSWSRFCTVNCRPLVSNYELSHIGFGAFDKGYNFTPIHGVATLKSSQGFFYKICYITQTLSITLNLIVTQSGAYSQFCLPHRRYWSTFGLQNFLRNFFCFPVCGWRGMCCLSGTVHCIYLLIWVKA